MALQQFRRRHLDRWVVRRCHVGQVGRTGRSARRLPLAFGKNRNTAPSAQRRERGRYATIRLRMSVFVRLACVVLPLMRDDCHLLARREPVRADLRSAPSRASRACQSRSRPTLAHSDSRLGKLSDGTQSPKAEAGTNATLALHHASSAGWTVPKHGVEESVYPRCGQRPAFVKIVNALARNPKRRGKRDRVAYALSNVRVTVPLTGSTITTVAPVRTPRRRSPRPLVSEPSAVGAKLPAILVLAASALASVPPRRSTFSAMSA